MIEEEGNRHLTEGINTDKDRQRLHMCSTLDRILHVTKTVGGTLLLCPFTLVSGSNGPYLMPYVNINIMPLTSQQIIARSTGTAIVRSERHGSLKADQLV